MILQFDNFKGTIENPTILINRVNDNILEKTCSVEILMQVDKVSLHATLDGFTYVDTWEDRDVAEWVSNKIKEFEV